VQEIHEEHKGVTYQTIHEDDAGIRADNYLIKVLKGVPKSMIYRILRKGEVRVNKKRIKPEYKLQSGDEIRIPPLRMSDAKVVLPSANLDKVSALKDAVLYENDGLMVINKPCFMPVHGGSGVSYGVIEALRSLRSDLHFLELAHRLDRETSGCLIIAKKRSVLRQLHEQFREKNMQKQYLALVRGEFSKRITTVRAPLLKNVLMSGERIVRVDEVNGKPSVTDFKIREKFHNVTLVEAWPHTGRTHQIRVHLAYKSHPILGDDKYGDAEFDKNYVSLGLDRMFLHAEHITFTDPVINKEVTVYAPLPDDLEKLLQNIREKEGVADV
jgi:23S rRNA pseudouridine955/2504/2580 synthase